MYLKCEQQCHIVTYYTMSVNRKDVVVWYKNAALFRIVLL